MAGNLQVEPLLLKSHKEHQVSMVQNKAKKCPITTFDSSWHEIYRWKPRTKSHRDTTSNSDAWETTVIITMIPTVQNKSMTSLFTFLPCVPKLSRSQRGGGTISHVSGEAHDASYKIPQKQILGFSEQSSKTSYQISQKQLPGLL